MKLLLFDGYNGDSEEDRKLPDRTGDMADSDGKMM